MATIDKPAVNGAELIDGLAQTGTGETKLELPRQVLGYVHRKEKRVASAAELIDAMEKAGRFEGYEHWPVTPPLTLEKARSIAATGAWNPAVRPKVVPVEKLILAGAALPEPPPVDPAVEMAGDVTDEPDPSELPPVGPERVAKPGAGAAKKKAAKKPARTRPADAPPVPLPAAPTA